ncbi:hypothetical protein L861_15625 [Litchfieldella anticariensis FP35 = DSM 16096]|uniref:Uncharacterized protein n=1 Tax=Litchfieldella anticariensis (strain DSM 16096 / CECT 5854 / CIP 108499 / LMG 22089 / FP35) TaxID=1121939 RepID=S2KNU4_LITA3|nr:hypothetical protein L861_15625 [Halomonas anticariensis FP35 = DSM 16096]
MVVTNIAMRHQYPRDICHLQENAGPGIRIDLLDSNLHLGRVINSASKSLRAVRSLSEFITPLPTERLDLFIGLLSRPFLIVGHGAKPD